jgi:hypothetical protein
MSLRSGRMLVDRCRGPELTQGVVPNVRSALHRVNEGPRQRALYVVTLPQPVRRDPG